MSVQPYLLFFWPLCEVICIDCCSFWFVLCPTSERAIDYLNTRERLFVVDGYAGWVPQYQLKVRVICARAYHALFIRYLNLLPFSYSLLSLSASSNFLSYFFCHQKHAR